MSDATVIITLPVMHSSESVVIHNQAQDQYPNLKRAKQTAIIMKSTTSQMSTSNPPSRLSSGSMDSQGRRSFSTVINPKIISMSPDSIRHSSPPNGQPNGHFSSSRANSASFESTRVSSTGSDYHGQSNLANGAVRSNDFEPNSSSLPNGTARTSKALDGHTTIPHSRTLPLSLSSNSNDDHQARGPRSPGLRVNSHTFEASRRGAPYPGPASASSKVSLSNPDNASRSLSFEAPSQAQIPNGHISPSPTSPTNHKRRGSLTLGGTLGRKISRSGNPEAHQEDVPAHVHDEDPSKWADPIRRQREKRRRRKEEEDDDRVLVGTKVDQHHVNWITAYDMLTGIRFSVSKTTAKMDRALVPEDFKETNKFSFDVIGSEVTPGAKYDFKFKDYSPWVFRHLRQQFGLDPADYLISLTSKYILSELGSPGKSGSFFYFSRDYKYIIKTIHHAEHKTLRRILQKYYDHAQKYPDTLLSQFYGLHRVKLPFGRKIHFVVMNNLFPPHLDIHRTFDLKGSTIGRSFNEVDIEKHPRAVLKDLNWTRRNMHLELGPQKKEKFVSQLEKDVQLLSELKIMDYSLLVGIHDLQRGNDENLREKTLQVFEPDPESDETVDSSFMTSDTINNSGISSIPDTQIGPGLVRAPTKEEATRKAKELRRNLRNRRPTPMGSASSKSRMPESLPPDSLNGRCKSYFYSDDGGFQATHDDDGPGEEVYYLGIIDCLTKYSTVKKSEHFFKGLTQPKSEISAVPPLAYGRRFLNFMKNIIAPGQKERKRTESPSANDRLPKVEE